MAGAAGADAFDEPHRGAASLYEGFALLSTDKKRADRAFDRAIELGGDTLEALRGKLLVAMSASGGERDQPVRSGREVAQAAHRFVPDLAVDAVSPASSHARRA